jgi:hypothetical protein
MIEYTVKVYPNGDKFWNLNGKCNREDGPAIECANGTKFWYLNGKCHREDGPAIEWSNGIKSWYLNHQEFNEKMNPKAKELSVSDISKLLGYEVKVVK